MISLDELKLQLSQTQTAISQILSGARRSKFQIGTSGFSRTYEYTETTLEDLERLRDSLIQQIRQQEGSSPKFVGNQTIPLIVGKDTRRY